MVAVIPPAGQAEPPEEEPSPSPDENVNMPDTEESPTPSEEKSPDEIKFQATPAPAGIKTRRYWILKFDPPPKFRE